jgi:hypothetical protein
MMRQIGGWSLLAGFVLLAVAGCGSNASSGTTPIGDPCAQSQECIPGSICFNQFCVGQGVFRVSLAFSVDSDYDLHVLTPNAVEIYFANRTADSGMLDVDQCISSCGTTPHAENIVFTTGAPTGMYTTWVRNYNGRGTGPFNIEVAGDATASFSGTLPATAGTDSTHFTFTR